MSQAQAQAKLVVRSQLIPLDGMRLVLPNTAIAEVISYQKPEPVADSPAWLLGTISWRGIETMPVIAFETASTEALVTPGKSSRIIVLNTLNEHSELHFYGILAQGIPRLISLDDSTIHDAPEIEGQSHDCVLRHTIIDSQQVIIPDQKALEQNLLQLKLA
jgi:chemosensory pili system protein ChpC